MRVLVAAMLVFVGGCGGSTGTPEQAAAVATPSPFCTYDTTAPTATAGDVSYSSRAPGVDCVAPEPGAVFSLGFAARGWWLQFDAPRYAVKVGEAQPIAFGAASLLVVQGEASCFQWSGTFTVMSDLPQWSIFIDATCKASGLRVVGQWSR